MIEIGKKSKQKNHSPQIIEMLFNYFRVDVRSNKVFQVSKKLLETLAITSLEEFEQLLETNYYNSFSIKDILLDKVLSGNLVDDLHFTIKNNTNLPKDYSFSIQLSPDKSYYEIIIFSAQDEKALEILQRDRKAFQVIAEAALSSDSLNALTQKVIEGITDTFDFELGSVMLYDESTKMLHVISYVDSTNSKEEPVPFSIDDPNYIHAYVARTKKAVFVQDVQNDPFVSRFLTKSVPDLNFKAFITWPLLDSKQKLLGTIQLISLNPKEIPERDRILFKSIAELFALAIEKTLAEKALHELNLTLEQRVIERTTELEAVNKELEAFSYSVSHDLRTPLRHISGFTELIKQKLKDQLNDNLRHYLDTIIKSSIEMNDLIDNLLHFSRISKTELKKEEINLEQLIKEIILEFEPEIKERKIDWKVKKLPRVQGDLSLVHIVMSNLLSNAIKFTKTRALAVIEIGSMKSKGKNESIIYIKDNGIGFDMKHQDKLFGVFQRLHTNQGFEGIGIGLATTKRIITKHGGRIWAEGVVNKGAIFYFTLG